MPMSQGTSAARARAPKPMATRSHSRRASASWLCIPRARVASGRTGRWDDIDEDCTSGAKRYKKPSFLRR